MKTILETSEFVSFNEWFFISVADDDCYPYEAEVGRCRHKKNDNLRTMACSIPASRPTEALYKMGPAYSLNNETDIMWEIFHYGPVQGKVEWKIKRENV